MQDQIGLLQETRNALSIEYQTTADKYNNTMSLIETEMKITEKEAQQKMQEEQMTMQKYQMAYSMYSDMQQREDKFKMADMDFLRNIETMAIDQQMKIESALQLDKIQF
jgi:hypothetical protein